MNFDELMAVWKIQDAAPLHGINQDLLAQALRQDEAALQKVRRKERRIQYSSSASVAVLLALLLALLVVGHQRYLLTAWDYVMVLGGVAAALVSGVAKFGEHRAQVRREQRFGETLRDQINRRLAQVDDVVAGAWRNVGSFVLMGVICPVAILHVGLRVNHKTLGEVSFVPVILLVLCVAAGARALRRHVQRAAARKRELEALLQQLDGR